MMVLDINGNEFIIDRESLDLYKSNKCYVNTYHEGRYKKVCVAKGKSFASLLFPEYDSKIHEVDHINGNPLDNRRENLRLCSHAENMLNKKMYRNNTSGHRGVHFYAAKKVWVAECRFNGVRYKKWSKDKQVAIDFYEKISTEKFGSFKRK